MQVNVFKKFSCIYGQTARLCKEIFVLIKRCFFARNLIYLSAINLWIGLTSKRQYCIIMRLEYRLIRIAEGRIVGIKNEREKNRFQKKIKNGAA